VIDDNGTMLHYAALWGKLELANLLLKSGRANLDIVNKKHGTSPQIAAYTGR
jgi:ankyrin repeat protein